MEPAPPPATPQGGGHLPAGEAEERYRRLFETMLHGVVHQDADGTITSVNPAAAEILGAPAGALVGLRSDDPSWHAVHEDGSPFPGSDHPAMESLRTGEVVRDVVMGVTDGRTGERRWLLVTAVPEESDQHGVPQSVYTMFTDITEQRRAAAALREWDRFLGRLRDTNVLGFVLADERRVLEANDAFLAMVGHDRGELTRGAVDWRAMTPPEWKPRDDAGIAELRDHGACHPYEKELIAASGRRVPVLVGAAVITHDPLTWVTFIVDLSERKQAEEERAALVASAVAARAEAERSDDRLQFLLRAGALVAAARDSEDLLQHAARLMVPTLADFAAVFVPTREGGLRLAVGEGLDAPSAQVLLDLVGRRLGWDDAPSLQATLQTGRSRLIADLSPHVRELLPDLEPVARTAAERLSGDSLVTAPLSVGTQRLGVLALGRLQGRATFAESDLPVVEELGRRLAVGLTNAEAFAREHGVAETLQRSVLPDRLPAVPGLDLAVRYLPATEGVGVGGDWYDAFPLGGSLFGLVIGDVVGHDLASATAMNQIRNTLRAFAVDHPDPAHVLERTNTALVRLLPEALATVFCAVLDRATGTLTYANAGHPPPLVATVRGTAYLHEPAGLMLGVDSAATFTNGTVRLGPECALLLYSDGLVEDRNRSIDDGLAALATVFTGHRGATAEAVCQQVEEALLRGSSRADDACLLAAVCVRDSQTAAGPGGRSVVMDTLLPR
jgi:PAS domain S-box-containing protein